MHEEDFGSYVSSNNAVAAEASGFIYKCSEHAWGMQMLESVRFTTDARSKAINVLITGLPMCLNCLQLSE